MNIVDVWKGKGGDTQRRLVIRTLEYFAVVLPLLLLLLVVGLVGVVIVLCFAFAAITGWGFFSHSPGWSWLSGTLNLISRGALGGGGEGRGGGGREVVEGILSRIRFWVRLAFRDFITERRSWGGGRGG